MKHCLKQHFIDGESFLKYFMKTYNIPFEQYVRDMDVFEEDGNYLIDQIQTRTVHGIDLFPYLYALHKISQIRPNYICNFVKYFKVIMQKYSNIQVDEDSITDIVRVYTSPVLILYLIYCIQYYFL